MCEVRVVIEDRDGSVVETLDDVATIIPAGDSLTLVDLFGNRTSVNAAFKEVKLLDHTVVLEKPASEAGQPQGGAADV
ncbi:MAG: hypothetical protein Kow0056_10850 [Coriobacteriia bacterium]